MTEAELGKFQRWSILIGAATMLSLAMGMRQSFGLFQPSIVRDIGITTADFSLATAVQNVVWGLSQPFIGVFADRFGARYVMLAGVFVYAAGLVTMMLATTALMFTLGAGLCVGLALSCTASSMTMTVTSRAVAAAKRSVAMGAVSAVGSLGLVIASPLAQTLISNAGWQIALVGFLGLVAVMLPSAFFAGKADRIEIAKADDTDQTLKAVVQSALGHPGYVVMAIAYFVCGLQLVFITTHLPNYLAICGLDPSLGATALALIGLFQRHRFIHIRLAGRALSEANSARLYLYGSFVRDRGVFRVAGDTGLNDDLRCDDGHFVAWRRAAGQRAGLAIVRPSLHGHADRNRVFEPSGRLVSWCLGRRRDL